MDSDRLYIIQIATHMSIHPQIYKYGLVTKEKYSTWWAKRKEIFGVQLRKLSYFRSVDCLRLVRCYSCYPPCVNAWSHSRHASSGSGMDNFDVLLVHCQCCHLCNEDSGEVLSRKMWHMGKLFLQRWEVSILRAKNWLPNKCSVSFHFLKVNTQNNVLYRR